VTYGLGIRCSILLSYGAMAGLLAGIVFQIILAGRHK
jgi:hypothetical protein